VSDGKLFASIYVDADLMPRVATALRQRNYACQSALEDGFGEASDEQILERAVELGMVLLTNNACHFAVLAQQWAYQGRDHTGILICEQFRRSEFGQFLRLLLRFLDAVTADEMRNGFRYLSEFRS